MAPEALAMEESELRAQREEGARKALKVRPLQDVKCTRTPDGLLNCMYLSNSPGIDKFNLHAGST